MQGRSDGLGGPFLVGAHRDEKLFEVVFIVSILTKVGVAICLDGFKVIVEMGPIGARWVFSENCPTNRSMQPW